MNNPEHTCELGNNISRGYSIDLSYLGLWKQDENGWRDIAQRIIKRTGEKDVFFLKMSKNALGVSRNDSLTGK